MLQESHEALSKVNEAPQRSAMVTLMCKQIEASMEAFKNDF